MNRLSVAALIVFSIVVTFGEYDGIGSYYPWRWGKPCTSSADCGQDLCCRDGAGNVIWGGNYERPFVIEPKLKTGKCGKRIGRKNALCSPDHCNKCEKGYTCYRPPSGVCCLPYKCHNATWVEEQRECYRSGKCLYPPVAPPPPGGGPGLLPTA